MNPEQQREMTAQRLSVILNYDAPTFVKRCADRVTEIEGGEKYYDAVKDRMLFEDLDLGQLCDMLEEEILDVPNYCAMIREVTGEHDERTKRIVQLALEMYKELTLRRAGV